MVTVVDTGSGNLRSLTNALSAQGFEPRILQAPPASPEGPVVLPGVGAFGPAAAALRERGWVSFLREQARRGLPLLGICLGMQLLFDASEESPGSEGLGLLAGSVGRLDPRADKVPHIRWARLEFADGGWEGARPEWAYFVHSYAARAVDAGMVVAWARHGGERFPAVVVSGSVTGVQFHPEKSQGPGVAYLGALMGGRS